MAFHSEETPQPQPASVPPPLPGSRGADAEFTPSGLRPPPLPVRRSTGPDGVKPLPSAAILEKRAPTRLARPELVRRPSILNLEELDRFKNLLLFAQAAVEGLYAGKHRSPLPGSSAEFRDFKHYNAGDPVDHVDWRAYGRTRRLYVRRYEDETDMTAYLLVDTSASMAYAGRDRHPKYLHAARLAATLSCLMIRQGDKAALGLFADKLTRFIPPGGTRQHLHDLVKTLENVKPSQGTGLESALEQAASVCKRRGRLILISDLHGDPAPLLDALSRFLHRGFRILLLQVLDPDELDLPAQHVARYQDMETGAAVEVDAEDLRAPYRERMKAALDGLARECVGRGIEHQIVDTSRGYTVALEAYLGFRHPSARI